MGASASRGDGRGGGARVGVGYRCPECSFALWHPIAPLDVSVLGLYDDARFPGRCLLVLDEHHEDLTELEPRLLHRFMDDVVEAAEAIRSVTQADRINYAVLGNTEPHVHFHLVPRRIADDPVPTRPPWEHPNGRYPLSSERRRRLLEELQGRFGDRMAHERGE